jgi:hypothetical protein
MIISSLLKKKYYSGWDLAEYFYSLGVLLKNN